jgi:hypothetical protein
LQEVIDVVEKIASVLTALGVIFLFFGSVTKRGQTAISNWFKKINEPTNKGIVCVLRSDLRRLCKDCIKQGFMTEEDLENIVEASEAYCALGGNSYTHALVERACTLPVKNYDGLEPDKN